MRRIRSLRDAEDVVTLLLQLLVNWGRRLARKAQAHIIQFSPITTISFYCKLQKHGADGAVSCVAAAALMQHRRCCHCVRRPEPACSAGCRRCGTCCAAAVAVLEAAAFKLLTGESLCSSPVRCRCALRCRHVLAGPLRVARPRHYPRTVTAQPMHAASIVHAYPLVWAEAAR